MKQWIAIGVAVLLVVFTAFRMVGCAKQYGAPKGPAKGYEAFYRCRDNGFETNLEPEQVLELIEAGKCMTDPLDGMNTLFECPDCGKLTLEAATRTPGGTLE